MLAKYVLSFRLMSQSKHLRYSFCTNLNKSMDYFKLLQVERQANQQQIKNAYIKKSRQYHPDINPGNEQKFKLLTEAYRTLSNPITKRQYIRDIQRQSINPSHVKQTQINQNDPIDELIRTNLRYMKVKSRQNLGMHISSHYTPSLKKDQIKQQEQRSYKFNEKWPKFFMKLSAFITSLLVIQMVGKYMYRNRVNQKK